MLKFLRNVFLIVVGLIVLFFCLALVASNTNAVDFNFFNLKTINLTLGGLVVGALSLGIIIGLLFDELANFLTSRVRKSKVKKLEEKLQKLTSE